MRFVLDENESPKLLEHWRLLFPGHAFEHVGNLGLKNTPDKLLFMELAQRGFEVIITRDKNQLHNPDELAALKESGLSWVGHNESKGFGAAAIQEIVAAYALGLPHVIDTLKKEQTPIQFRLRKPAKSASQLLKAKRLSDGSKVNLPR